MPLPSDWPDYNKSMIFTLEEITKLCNKYDIKPTAAFGVAAWGELGIFLGKIDDKKIVRPKIILGDNEDTFCTTSCSWHNTKGMGLLIVFSGDGEPNYAFGGNGLSYSGNIKQFALDEPLSKEFLEKLIEIAGVKT